ncbi:MAG: serine/threonine protein kinase [Clostridiales bacterium]|nr:serine/threonine protein kinase [Clostridiales bacterium]
MGKYEVCRMLGRGRSAAVYLARHAELGEYRAIKQAPRICGSYLNFRREAHILEAVRAPGIPRVYGVEEDWQYAYLIEEYLEGDSLYDLVSDMGHVPLATAIQYGIGVCRLINILHTARPRAVLHLDIQPKNLIIYRDTVKLIDFDRATFLGETGKIPFRYGTAGFAAPEQYAGDPPDERTDVYAIGAVLYYMWTGGCPGECASIPKGIAGWQLCRIIFSCLRRDRRKRFPSVVRLCEALERIRDGL